MDVRRRRAEAHAPLHLGRAPPRPDSRRSTPRGRVAARPRAIRPGGTRPLAQPHARRLCARPRAGVAADAGGAGTL
eukprot:1018799-Pleurochrysis_carterae.AAC.1